MGTKPEPKVTGSRNEADTLIKSRSWRRSPGASQLWLIFCPWLILLVMGYPILIHGRVGYFGRTLIKRSVMHANFVTMTCCNVLEHISTKNRCTVNRGDFEQFWVTLNSFGWLWTLSCAIDRAKTNGLVLYDSFELISNNQWSRNMPDMSGRLLLMSDRELTPCRTFCPARSNKHKCRQSK